MFFLQLDQANGMLKYIETMLFSPKSVSQLASGDKESEAIQKDILIQEQYRTKLFVVSAGVPTESANTK